MRRSSRTSVPTIARPRQTISAAVESRNLSALTTAFAAASNDAGARIGALTSWPSLPLSPYSTCCSAKTKRPTAMKNRAQAPKSSRKGCVAEGPNARPAIRLRTNGTPQARATNIAALRPASRASSLSTPRRRCNSKNGGEIFPDPARLVPVGVDPVSGAHAPRDAGHFSFPLRPVRWRFQRRLGWLATVLAGAPLPRKWFGGDSLDCASYCCFFEIAGRALIPAPPTTAPPPRSGIRATP